MNVLYRFFVRAGLLLAVAILGGCASGPPAVVPDRGYDYAPGYGRGFDSRMPLAVGRGQLFEVQRANACVAVWIEGRGRKCLDPSQIPAGAQILESESAYAGAPRFGYRGLTPGVGLERPMYRATDLDAMMREVQVQLLARCQGDGRATDIASQTAGTAAGGAVAGAILNGGPGALALGALGALAGASRAADYGRFNCQALINERDFIRKQHFLLEEWQRQETRRDRFEERREVLDTFRRR